jgi:hypothetical protein
MSIHLQVTNLLIDMGKKSYVSPFWHHRCKMQHNHDNNDNMRLIYANMQVNYVNMRLIYVNIWLIYDNMQDNYAR